jgi:hypothetical protein
MKRSAFEHCVINILTAVIFATIGGAAWAADSVRIMDDGNSDLVWPNLQNVQNRQAGT